MNLAQLDDAFPTVVRYTGLAMIPVLVVGTVLGYGLLLAPGWGAATLMIGYKVVVDANKKPDG